MNVKRSLHKNLEHWHLICANHSVIDTLEIGYKILFFFQNNQSAFPNANFVLCTVKDLLNSGRIKETRAACYIVKQRRI